MIESKVLSSGGRAEVNGIVIPPYPKMLHATEIKEEMVAQVKIDGYNVRLIKINDQLIPLLRGGMVDKKTSELFKIYLPKTFDSFFAENPKKILCMEIIGKKTMACYKGDKDIDYFVFDIMDLEKEEDERFLPYSVVKELCQKHNLNMVDVVGEFNSLDKLNKEMTKLPGIYEGVVLKSLDGKRILKYKWEDNPELFKDKIPIREKKQFIESEEARIVSHFFQGYEEKELGLKKGISPEEFREYENLIEKLALVEKNKIGEQVNKITSFLMEKIMEKGSFNKELKKKIEKEFRKKIGKEVGKLMRRT